MNNPAVNVSSSRLEQAVGILRRLNLLVLAILALSLFAHKIIDTDIWWHLSAGRHIIQNGSIPAADPFSYTAGGNEWIDLHWLFQVLVYGVYHTLGSYSLSLLFIITYAAAFIFSWLTCRSEGSRMLDMFFLWLALMAAGSRFLERPEAFTYLMIALYTFILYKHDRGQIRRLVFLLIPLQALWTNLQGLFILGPCLIFAYAIEALGGSILKNRDRPHFPGWKKWGLSLFSGNGAGEKSVRLTAVFILSIAASLFNPYGVKGLLFPIVLFTRAGGLENVFAGAIAELQPPFSGYNFTMPLVYFAVFSVVSALAIGLDWRNARLSHILIFVGMGYLGLNARRNVPVFIFSCVPLAVEHLRNIVSRWRGLLKKIGTDPIFQGGKNGVCPYFLVQVVFLGVMLVQLVQVGTNRYYIADRRAERFGFGFKEQTFARGGFEFIREAGVGGPFFNSLDIGGLFMWELYPTERVFIDARLEVNSESTFSEYCDVLSDPRRFAGLAEKYGFQAAIISHNSADGLYLVPAIYGTPGWFLVYLDAVAAVFVRGVAANAELITRYRIDLDGDPIAAAVPESFNDHNPRIMKYALDAVTSLAPSDAQAQGDFSLGLVLLVLGQNERAAERFKAGLEVQPHSAEAYYNMGLAFERMGRKETAIHCYQKAIQLKKNHALAHMNLGRMYDERGLEEQAEREYKLSLRRSGDNAVPLYNLGALYYERGHHEEARRYWRRALKEDPSFRPAREALERLDAQS